MIELEKRIWALLVFGMCVGDVAESLPGGQPTILSGKVADITGAVIPGAIVLIRNQQNSSSQKVVTDRSGKFKITDIDPGIYTIKVRKTGFETFVLSDLRLGRETRKVLNIKMSLCEMHNLGKRVPNFSTLLDIRAQSDIEKGLLAQAEALPCPDDKPGAGWLEHQLDRPRLRPRPTCANVEGMHYYFDLVKQNQRGHLPEWGEGPVEARAYYGGVVQFDKTAGEWTVTLTLEYAIHCGILCGGAVRHTRLVTFGQQNRVVKLEDGPDGVCGWIS